MEHMWLFSVLQCVLSVVIIMVSVRTCMALAGGNVSVGVQRRSQETVTGPRSGSVSCCLRLCLGWVGAVGGAVEVPVSVLLNLRTAQCLYTCITLVCCPLLVRQFTMCLQLLLTLDAHLQYRLAARYSSVVTRRRALCVVLLCWMGSVLSSFAQFIGWDTLDTWSQEGGLVGLGGNWTTTTPPPLGIYPQDKSVIGQHLPYGGFLSKFYIEDLHNFTYAQIHGSHWGVCAPDTVLSPEFLVYVYGVAVFLLPFLGLLAIYLDLLCVKSRQQIIIGPAGPPKGDSSRARSLVLSLSLLVLLCLPQHITHVLLLFNPSTMPPIWACPVATFLSQIYCLVPQLLFTPARRRAEGERSSLPLSLPHLPPAGTPSRGKAVGRALVEAVHGAPWCSAKHSLKAKVCPGITKQ